jgi:hypothetical protein
MPMNVNYDGGGWNADYVASLNEDEFVQQFESHYSHVENENRRVKALEAAYRFILGEYKRAHPEFIEKPE